MAGNQTEAVFLDTIRMTRLPKMWDMWAKTFQESRLVAPEARHSLVVCLVELRRSQGFVTVMRLQTRHPPPVLSSCVGLLLPSDFKYCAETQVYCYQSHLPKLDKCILMQIIKR